MFISIFTRQINGWMDGCESTFYLLTYLLTVSVWYDQVKCLRIRQTSGWSQLLVAHCTSTRNIYWRYVNLLNSQPNNSLWILVWAAICWIIASHICSQYDKNECSLFVFDLITVIFICSVIFVGVQATGPGAAAPQTRAKPLFFWQKLNFSGGSQQLKMKKKLSYMY